MPKKVNPRDKVVEKIATAKIQKKTIVLATGVFDILHKEHIVFLKKARAIRRPQEMR